MANEHPNPTPPPPIAGDPLKALANYEKAVSGLRAGLLDLEASPSYLMLTSEELGSATMVKVGKAAAGATELWSKLQAVDGALTQVRDYVDEHGVKGEHRIEVRNLLSRSWVSVAQSPDSSSPTGAAHRTIGELLGEVRLIYDAIRPWVTEIESLWMAILPRLDAAKATLARLKAEIDELGVPEPLIGRAEALVSDLEQRLVSDPVGVVMADGDQLDSQVAAAAHQVASLRASRDALEEDVAGTEELLATLRVLRARAEAAAQQAEVKVVDPQDLITVPAAAILDAPGGLGERLDQFFAQDRAAAWSQRRGLLDGWLSTARKLEKQLVRAQQANSKPVRRRDELRGRLTAYRAKIAAVGKAEDLDLTSLVDDARAELYTAPTDLERASTTIEELARKLRS